MLTIVSSCSSGVNLSISEVRRIIPLRLASKTVSIKADVELCAFVNSPIPALLKRYSTSNEFVVRNLPTFFISSSIPTLQIIDSVKEFFEVFLSLAEASASLLLFFPRMRTFFPDLIRKLAISSPSPLVPPLITEIFFIFIFFQMYLLYSEK